MKYAIIALLIASPVAAQSYEPVCHMSEIPTWQQYLSCQLNKRAIIGNMRRKQDAETHMRNAKTDLEKQGWKTEADAADAAVAYYTEAYNKSFVKP